MHKYLALIVLVIIGFFLNTATLAQTYQFITVASPGCAPIQLQRIGGTGILSIAARLTKAGTLRGYVVTLDTQKLTYHQLTEKMRAHHCTNKTAVVTFDPRQHQATEAMRH